MNPGEIYKTYLEAGADWADKHGAAELLEGTLKTLLAQLTLEAQNSEGCSNVAAKDHALASNSYRDAMKASIDARTQANRAKVRYTAIQALFEARRTAEATERAAMRSAT